MPIYIWQRRHHHARTWTAFPESRVPLSVRIAYHQRPDREEVPSAVYYYRRIELDDKNDLKEQPDAADR